MVNGVSGRRSANVARPVEKGRKLEPVPAPTPHPQEAEGTVRGKPNRPRNVNVENAEVWRLSIFIEIMLTIYYNTCKYMRDRIHDFSYIYLHSIPSTDIF